jgi:Flp pilus assembly protein TadG
MQLARKFLRDTSGAVAVEMAILIPLFSTMMLGISDFGMAMYQKMEVNNAVQAGTAYAMFHRTETFATMQGNITVAMSAATGLAGVTATLPTEFTGCPTASGIVAGSTSCAGVPAGVYVTVSATYSYSPILPWPGFAASTTVSQTVRIS